MTKIKGKAIIRATKGEVCKIIFSSGGIAKQRENTAATATKKTLAPYDTRFKPSEICFICINRLVSSTANLTIRQATKNQKIGEI